VLAGAIGEIPHHKKPVNGMLGTGPTCDAKAIWVGLPDKLGLCDERPECVAVDPPIKDVRSVIARGVAVSARAAKLPDNDSRQQLVLVRARLRTGKTEEKIVRLPSHARFGDFFVADDKVIGTVKGPKPGEVELY
jgi:hypothetical protein